jgi:phage FluMu gp28-like protein
VTIVDAVEQGLVELINRTVGTAFTREEFLADCKQQSGPHFDEEFMCVPSGEESSYFPSSLTRPCATVPASVIIDRVGDSVRTPSAEWQAHLVLWNLEVAARSRGASGVFVGVDVGRSVDRFVAWAIAKFGETYRTVGILVWQDMPFEAMERACDLVMRWRDNDGRTVRRMVIDATGIGAQLGEAMERNHRHRAEGVTFTPEFKADIFTNLRTHVEQRTIELPDDVATLADLASIAKTITTAGKVRFAGARTKDGHADRATALALALHAADEGGEPVAVGRMIAPGGDW